MKNMKELEDKIRDTIRRELDHMIDIDSFLKNMQEAMKHLPETLAVAIVAECLTEKPHPKGCFCKDCVDNIFDDLDDLVDLNS